MDNNDDHPLIDKVVGDFNSLPVSQWDAQITPNVYALSQTLGKGQFQKDLDVINSAVDFTKLGFNEDFKIVGVEQGKMMTDRMPRLENGQRFAINHLPTNSPNNPFTTPGVELGDSALDIDRNSSFDGVFNVISPPGAPHQLGVSPASHDLSIGDEAVADSTLKWPDGKSSKRESFNGHFPDGILGLGATSFNGFDALDTGGKIFARDTEYHRGLLSRGITFEGPDGPQYIPDVQKVQTLRMMNGFYQTSIQTGQRADWRALSDARGHIISLEQTYD